MSNNDLEMQGYFIEEAAELLVDIDDCIGKCFPITDVKSEPLADLRRHFHTLKGSALMVSAFAIASLAKPFEDMFSQIISGAAPVDDRIESITRAAYDRVPAMLEDLKNAVEPPNDYQHLIDTAIHIGFPNGQPDENGVVQADAKEKAAAMAASVAVADATETAKPAETAETTTAEPVAVEDATPPAPAELEAICERVSLVEMAIEDIQKQCDSHASTLGDADTAFAGFTEQLEQLSAARSQDMEAINSARSTAERALNAASGAETSVRQFIAKQEEAASLRNEDDEINKLREELAATQANYGELQQQLETLRQSLETVAAEQANPSTPPPAALNSALVFALIGVSALLGLVGCLI